MPAPTTDLLGRASAASSVQITYDKMSDPVLIEISLCHEERGTEAEIDTLIKCTALLQTG
jgi:hypothetical protein